MLNKNILSFGQLIIAANPSIKKPSKGDRKASLVIWLSRTVIELNNISSVINRTANCMIALTSLIPSKKYE